MEWEQILSGEISREQALPKINAAATQLANLIEHQPETEADIRRVFERRLVEPIDTGTMEKLVSSLGVILDEELLGLINWALYSIRQGDDLSWLSGQDVSVLKRIVRSLHALYGQELGTAIMRGGELPDDWGSSNFSVYFDLFSERHLLKLRVEKFNAETVIIEGDQNSFLNLSAAIIRVLHSLDMPDEFQSESVNDFIDAATNMIEFLNAEETGETIEE